MPSVSVIPALAVTALCGICLMYFGQWRAQQRLRSLLRTEMSRISEQLDHFRLDPLQAEASTTVKHSAAAAVGAAQQRQRASVPAAFQRSACLPTGEAYAAALELAADGADAAELTTRCGLSRDEARILVALQSAAGRRANAA